MKTMNTEADLLKNKSNENYAPCKIEGPKYGRY